MERGIPFCREDFFRGEAFRDLVDMHGRRGARAMTPPERGSCETRDEDLSSRVGIGARGKTRVCEPGLGSRGRSLLDWAPW